MRYKIHLFILVCLLLAGGGSYYFFQHNKSAHQAPATKEAALLTVKKGPLKVIVEATGQVVPAREIEIKCKASGEVVNLPLDISDPVKKDELLVQLDPSDEERSVKRAELALRISQSRLIQARLNQEITAKMLVTDNMRANAATPL